MLNKQATRFLNRKLVKDIVKDKILTEFHINRLNALFVTFRCKEIENMHATIAKFVLYDLNNYHGRIRRLKGTNGTSEYTQLLRYGKKEFTRIYAEQTEKKTNRWPNKINHWMEKGYSREEAEHEISEVQTHRSALSPASQKGASEYSVRCTAYWVKRGYSEDEAKTMVGESQRRKHTAERNARWQVTLNSKPQDEKDLINLKKGHSIDAYIACGYSEEEALKKSNAYYSKRKNYSDSSQVFFGILEALLQSNDVVYYKIRNYEKQFYGKCADFYDSESGVVVEYNGDFWHRNPTKYKGDDVLYGKSATDIWAADAARTVLIKSHPDVKDVIIVWESDVRQNPHLMAENIVKEIQKCKQQKKSL